MRYNRSINQFVTQYREITQQKHVPGKGCSCMEPLILAIRHVAELSKLAKRLQLLPNSVAEFVGVKKSALRCDGKQLTSHDGSPFLMSAPTRLLLG